MFGARLKGKLWEPGRVTSAADRARKRNLTRAGAFLRRRAMSGIRKRKKPAPPGKPPSSHLGLLKRSIFFDYDPATRSEVVGAIRLPGHPGEAQSALEHSGLSTLKSRRGTYRAQISEHPFMAPALAAEVAAGTIPAVWAGSVK